MPRNMKEETEMEQALLFSRVSSSKQASKSKFAQTYKSAEDYCKGGYTNKKGARYNLAKKHFKLTGSAFHTDIRNSEEMLEIFQNLENGTFKKPLHLLVANADRLDRRKFNQAFTGLVALSERGIILHELRSGTILDLVNEDVDPNESMMSCMYFFNCLIRAWEESETKSARAKNAYQKKRDLVIKNQKRKDSKVIYGGSLPKWIEGYDQKHNQFILNNVEVKKAQYIFKRILEGLGSGKLCTELNRLAETNKDFECLANARVAEEIGEKNVNKSGKRVWTPSYIKAIYSNKAVYGVKTFGKGNVSKDEREETEVPDYYPVIVSKEDFNKAKEIISSRRNKGKVPYDPSPFSYLCRCYYCRDGDSISTSQARRREYNKNNPTKLGMYYFSCSASSSGSKQCSSTRTWEEDLQEVFFAFLKEVDVSKILNPDQGNKAKVIDSEIAILLEKKLEQEDLKVKLLGMIASTNDIPELSKMLNKADKEITILQDEIDSLEMEKASLKELSFNEEDKNTFKNIQKYLNDPDQVQMINLKLRKIISSIELAPHGLPLEKTFEKFEGMGKKEHIKKLYGKHFPALRIIFKNGVSRLIFWQKSNLKNSCCIYEENNQYLIENSWGVSMVVGSKEFAKDKIGATFFDEELPDSKKEFAEDLYGKDQESKDKYLARVVRSRIAYWNMGSPEKFQAKKKLFNSVILEPQEV